ncbi:5734_t:CDS:2, partial [Racocetra fulgida]
MQLEQQFDQNEWNSAELQEYLLYLEQREKDVRLYEDYISYSQKYYGLGVKQSPG